jgi:hypothetical protein
VDDLAATVPWLSCETTFKSSRLDHVLVIFVNELMCSSTSFLHCSMEHEGTGYEAIAFLGRKSMQASGHSRTAFVRCRLRRCTGPPFALYKALPKQILFEVLRQDWGFPLSTFHFPLFTPVLQQDWDFFAIRFAPARLGS